MSDPSMLYAACALLLAVPFVCLAYWLIVDAKDKAEMRRHEAAMAALGARLHRKHQDEGRYTTDVPGRPE